MDPPIRPSSGPYDYDLLVIGGGSGGLAVAKEAAGLRKKVLILDLTAPSPRGTTRELGGSRLNLDSVRRFLHQASLLGTAVRDSEKYGWRRTKEKTPHGWSELVEAVQQQVKTRSVGLRRELKCAGVFYLNARGEIVAPHTVEATEANGRKRRLTAETLVIATGDTPQYLGSPGERELCLTSEDLLSLPRPPGRTLVVGGSAEGLECAGFLLGLGQPVSVVPQPEPDLLPGLDRKMAQMIENHMMVGGVEFLHDWTLSKVEQSEACSKDVVSGASRRLRVTLTSREGQTKQEDFDTVLLAVGRKAAVGGDDVVGLQSVGVQCSPDTGRIVVNDRDQTSVDHIYAIGSVQHGRPSTTGLSVHAGTLLARRLYREDTILCDYTNVPTVVLTPLEYTACGLSEERANLTFGEDSVEVYHSHYWPLEWELPDRDKYCCYVKVICHVPEHERVVGLHIMGPNAGDVLQGFAAAMKCGLTKQQLDSTVGIHPGSAQVLTSLTETRRMTEALMVRAGNC